MAFPIPAFLRGPAKTTFRRPRKNACFYFGPFTGPRKKGAPGEGRFAIRPFLRGTVSAKTLSPAFGGGYF